MEDSTHEVFVSSPNGNMFVTGVPDDCEHDWSDNVMVTSSGKVIKWHTFKQWASYTSAMRDRLIVKHQDEIGDPVNSQMPCCRKCGKVYNPMNDPATWEI